MKKLNEAILKPALILCLFVCSVTAYCQVQEVSLRAPDGIKIDGKTYEWPNNKLQVYNKLNRILYTICNDDENLYLTVRGPYFYGPAKMIRGGLTFTVSRFADKKARQKAKDNVSVTFPYIDPAAAQSIVSSINDYSDMAHDTARRQPEHDSLVKVVNAKTTAAIKVIKIAGIQAIDDTIISIYNTTGLKAMGTFNRGMAFTLEIAIPLKYLGMSINDVSPFSYNIKMNEPRPIPRPASDGFPARGGMGVMISDVAVGTGGMGAPRINPDFEYLNDATDFWGEYVLAKKP